MATTTETKTTPKPSTTTAPAPPASTTATPEAQAGNQALMGLQEDGSYKIMLGNGITIASTLFKGRKANLSDAGLAIPGVRLTSFKKSAGKRPSGTLTGQVVLPKVNKQSKVTIAVNKEGKVGKISASKSIKLEFAALNNPTITSLDFDENQQFAATMKINSNKLKSGIPGLKVKDVSASVSVRGGAYSGSFSASLSYPNLADGKFTIDFAEGGAITGKGDIAMTHPLLTGVTGVYELADDKLKSTIAVPVAKLAPKVPGLAFTAGQVTLNSEDGALSGGLAGVTFDYRGFASGSVDATIAKNKLSGKGDFRSSLSALSEVSGSLSYQNNKFSGSMTISASDFPETLPIKSGSITGTIDNEGHLGFDGSLTAELGPVGQGTFSASMDSEGNTSIAADVDLAIPGLQGAKFHIALVNGELEGSGDIPINPEILQGVSGNVHIEYKQNRWSGETEFAYSADEGRLSGTLKVGVLQNEENALNVYGGGSLTMKLSDKITGTVGAEIDPQAKVTLNMNIAVDPLELFPEKRIDKELFSYSQNIPLWAILVAVIRMRAGMRAGIGPGQLKDISVTGTYTIGDPEGPDLDFTGELFIPAFAEAYVAFGAGLGVDVLIGSLTGGIEGVATAGIYGAISVKPLLQYDNGDWTISGTATMAAGARFKLGLNAWAEAEAAWITVWENTWKLGEKTWNIGPNLALQFQLQKYVLGSGQTPEVTMEKPDVGGIDSMINDAMPKDAPAPSGARGAMEKQKGAWKGPKKGEGKAPAATSAQQQSAAVPPMKDPKAKPPVAVPKKPAKKKTKPPKDKVKDKDKDKIKPKGQGKNDKKGGDKIDRKEKGDPTVTDDKVAKDPKKVNVPRHPATISLKMLDEPPVTTPRTAVQKQADLTAAVKMVALVAKKAGDADKSDDYFGRIQKRFRLTDIGFVADGADGYKIKLSVNPIASYGDPIPASGFFASGRSTSIVHRKGKLKGVDVGTEMTADWLGPDHDFGSDSTSGQQTNLMKLLQTDDSKPNNQKYIRGHLLNAQLGGPAKPHNLFPITAEANEIHKNTIEKKAKDWVNKRKLWVFYEVKVSSVDGDKHITKTDPSEIEHNYVNAKFHCSLYQRSTKSAAKGEISTVTIASRYRLPPTATPVGGRPVDQTRAQNITDVKDVAEPESSKPFKQRTKDKNTKVRVIGEGVVYIHPELQDNLKDLLKVTTWTQIKAKLVTIDGVGSDTAEALKSAYEKRRTGYTGKHKGMVTRFNTFYKDATKRADIESKLGI